MALLDIAIAGGGIGGMAAAIALMRQGHRITVYEQASGWGRVGADVNLTPNVVKALDGLGGQVGAYIRREGAQPTFRISRDWDTGLETSRLGMGQTAQQQYGAPQVTIHRADLLAALAAEVPESQILLGRRLKSLAQDDAGVELQFEDGSSARHEVLIGADGIANFIDRDFDLNPVTVLKAGVAARLRNDGLEHAMAKDPGRVQPMLDLYRCRTAQYALNTCCFARHPLTQRISRLLLRAGISFGRGNDITLTQEEIARLVATRRETVTDILNRFAREGVIELHRSVIRILRRDILRTHSCDCFTEEMKLEKNCAQSIASMFRGFEYGASADKRQRPNESITAGAA